MRFRGNVKCALICAFLVILTPWAGSKVQADWKVTANNKNLKTNQDLFYNQNNKVTALSGAIHIIQDEDEVVQFTTPTYRYCALIWKSKRPFVFCLTTQYEFWYFVPEHSAVLQFSKTLTINFSRRIGK